MGIRKAKIEDWQEIRDLLQQLDYGDTAIFLKEKIAMLLNHPDAELLVYEYQERVVAFISIQFFPQIALKGDFARISYFAVDQGFRSQGIGREMEEYCVASAKRRNCDRIEVHSHSRRERAHQFYFRQGYIESPKYLIKKLV